MSKEGYKRLLRATYSHLENNPMSEMTKYYLDELMLLPSPLKENIFVWSSGKLVKSSVDNDISINIEFLNEPHSITL